MEKGTSIPLLEIESFTSQGVGIGRHQNEVIFVKNTVPSDVVEVEILRQKKNFSEAKVVNFVKQSKMRATPFCEHYKLCGGCSLQHITYESQLKFKQQWVKEALEKIGKFDEVHVNPIIPAPETTYYRNKLEFSFTSARWLTREDVASKGLLNKNALGFHVQNKYDKILNINQCFLQRDPSNSIRNTLKDFAETRGFTFYDLKRQIGLLRNLIIRISSKDEVMVVVIFGENDKLAIEETMQFLKESFSITSLMYAVNTKPNDSIYDLSIRLFSGTHFITEKLGDLDFKIGPKSFYQTNSKQMEKLYKVVFDMAQLNGDELVYDLYSGIGTFGNYLAKACKKVVGIESVPEAVENANENSKMNGNTHVESFVGDMKTLFDDDFVSRNGVPDIAIIDPPRGGMHLKVVKQLAKMKVPKLIYVSCNPSTQARDLEILKDVYQMKEIQPVDMFPHTPHVENIILLKPINHAE